MNGYRVYCVGEGSVDLVDALTELGYVPAQPDVLALDAAKQRAELRAADMADTIKAQAATIAALTMERDELAAKWAAVPWAAIDAIVGPVTYGPSNKANVAEWLGKYMTD